MYHIIANPNSNRGKGKYKLKKIEKILTAHNVEYKIHPTNNKNHATEIAKQLTLAGETEIIAVGGDGTFHEVLNGLQNYENVHLGLIPTGTGNDFIVSAKIPNNIEKAVELILNGTPKETDFIQVAEKRSLNVAGMGMDVDVLERYERSRFFHGKFKYLISLVKSICLFKSYAITVKVNGEEKKHNSLFMALCNGSQIGGGIRICPTAVCDDGKLELVVVDYMNKFQLFRIFMALMRGKILQFPLTQHWYCESVEVIPDTPHICQLDGELYNNLPFKAHICHGLKIYR